MPCPRRRPGKRCLIVLGAFVLASLAWVAFVANVPTDCARRKIEQRLARAMGRRVTLGRLRVGPFGGVVLHDLTIGAPGSGSGDDPWLQVVEAKINVSLRQLLFGQVDPTRIDIRGVHLRVLRRRDGRLELADLLRAGPDPTATSSVPASVCEPKELEARVADATISIRDEPTGTTLDITRVEGRGTYRGSLVSVTTLSGTLNGGTIQLAAQVDRSDVGPRFEGQLRVRDAALSQGMQALGYLVPVLVGTRPALEGRLTLDLYLRGQGDSHAAIAETLIGQGRLGLDPVALDGSRLLTGMADLFDLPSSLRVGDVWADLTIRNGRVVSENLTVDVARVPVVLTGWTDFDGRIAYRLKTDGLIETLPAKAQEFLGRLKPGLKVNELADVRIEGTVDALSVTAHGLPITRGEPCEVLPRIGQRVRGQLLR